MSAVSFHPMTHADAELLAEWIPQTPLWRRYGLTSARAFSLLLGGIDAGDVLSVAAIDDDPAPAGFAWMLPRGTFGRSPYLRWIGIRPGLRGHGLGGALLTHVESLAADHGRELFLLAADFNTEAQHFYIRHGYVQAGILPDYVVPGVAELLYFKRLDAQTRSGITTPTAE
ncbi:MAG: GNAT family N-acetyltransferase [Chloroflexi bacterium]|nr:MAG: N-acetyltransferase GCN5 [Chloroflexi bacterium OLB13]MBC6957234.1 GNAT family N-acetyltransferase [Chloroflexota bacterium]MBV6437079.1 hypothetical protein [Anaerolineae bacterium]MDL1916536.1 GNAT family N-acetyltransferase [Anaerolineae bacterium CFX4]OQY81669.1 MAG: hypothetical protein B6D42_10820 [Anaerolineae bacterium UTCFX5]